MRSSKISPAAGGISIVLGLIGIFTGIYIIGGIIGIAGLILGFIGYPENRKVSLIGIFLSLAAIAWTLIFYTLWDAIFPFVTVF